MSRRLTLQDGRTLAYNVYGDPKGTPVIFSHGLSDSSRLKCFDDSVAESLGVQVIAVDQPGVGGSSNVNSLRKERTLENYANDIRQLADALKLEKFAVAGHSGGGPHSLAVAYYLGPDRVRRVILAAPAPPLDGSVQTFDFPGAGLILYLCRYMGLLIHAFCVVTAWWANRNIPNYLDLAASLDRDDGVVEGTFWRHPKQQKILVESFTAGFAQGAAGISGMCHIALIQGHAWGFDIRDIQQPVDFFMSDLDAVIPPVFGQRMCDIMSNATIRKTWSQAGHYSFVDKECWIDFLSAVKNDDDDNNSADNKKKQ